MKITNKTTKEDLMKFLNDSYKVIKTADKNLYDRIMYAGKCYSKDHASVTKGDLASLVKEVVSVLAKTPSNTQVVAENSTRTLKKSSKKSQEVASESVKEESKKEVKKSETPKKDTKKDTKETPKDTPKKEKVSGVEKVLNKEEEVSPKARLLAEVFKDSFEIEIDGENTKFELAKDIKTMKDLIKAVAPNENGEEPPMIVFAAYWTKRHLRQFNYFDGQVEAPEEFELDLDLATCIYVSDEGKIAYALSMYTEGLYVFTPRDLEEVQGVRFSNGLEYQIYRQVTE